MYVLWTGVTIDIIVGVKVWLRVRLWVDFFAEFQSRFLDLMLLKLRQATKEYHSPSI